MDDERLLSSFKSLISKYIWENGAESPHSSRRPPKVPRSWAVEEESLPLKEETFMNELSELIIEFEDISTLQNAAEVLILDRIIQCSQNQMQADFLLKIIQQLSANSAFSWNSFIPSFLKACVPSSGSPTLTSFTTGSEVVQYLLSSSPSAAASRVNKTEVEEGSTGAASTIAEWRKPFICRILSTAIDSEDLMPATCLEMLCQTVLWLNHAFLHPILKDGQAKTLQSNTIHSCIEVVKKLIDSNKNFVPFYTVLHHATKIESHLAPDDEESYFLLSEIHRRRDSIAGYMTPSDGHLHVPTFSTARPLAMTYTGPMGEPLQGQDVAESIPWNSEDYHRALRCISHALRCHPASDWWRRVLFLPTSQLPAGMGQMSSQLRVQSMSVMALAPTFSPTMTCDAVVDRVVELVQISEGSESTLEAEQTTWYAWLTFSDIFYYIIRWGFLDLHEFLDRLYHRFLPGGRPKTNHITWLLAQVARVETVLNVLQRESPARLKETVHKIQWFHAAPSGDKSPAPSAWHVLLDYVSSCQILRLWSQNRALMEEHVAVSEHMKKGRYMDDWWRQTAKGPDRVLDYCQLDEQTTGMVWVLSHAMSHPVCEALVAWMRTPGPEERVTVYPGRPAQSRFKEGRPLPMSFLLGLSWQVIQRLVASVEEIISLEQYIISVSMLESYARMLHTSPHIMHSQQTVHMPMASHSTMAKVNLQSCLLKYEAGKSQNGVPILLLELINYRLLPFFKYHGKIRGLLLDLAKILITGKREPREHRLYRLAEATAINIIMSLKDVILIRKEQKGASTDLSETLNRLMIMNLAITIKTMGIHEPEQLTLLPAAVDQILACSTHKWSEKTLRHYPDLLRDLLQQRKVDRKSSVESWKQVEGQIVQIASQFIRQDQPNVTLFLNGLPRELLPHLCSVAWVLIASTNMPSQTNLSAAIRELSPEEVSVNVYNMVDVLLHTIEAQQANQMGNILVTAVRTLTNLVWVEEVVPFDILMLALMDRDDVQFSLRLAVGLLVDRPDLLQRAELFCATRGPPQHWEQTGGFTSMEPKEALGMPLAGRDLYPIFFDHICLRAIPIIQIAVYRLIEHDALETADRVISSYSTGRCNLLAFHPFYFTFVRQLLAYFHPSLTPKLTIRLLTSLDSCKVPFSDSFVENLKSRPGQIPEGSYFISLISGLAERVLPPLNHPARTFSSSLESPINSHGRLTYTHINTGTYQQLLLDTAAIELLSLPHSPPDSPRVAVSNHPTLLVRALMAAVLRPVGCSVPVSLLLQAAGLLLAQLPLPFQSALYLESVRLFKQNSWLTDGSCGRDEVDSMFELSTADPSWSSANAIYSEMGGLIALLHATFINLPFQWLENCLLLVTSQQPISTVTQLRLVLRLLGPIMPRVALHRPLYLKTMSVLFSAMRDVCGHTASFDITGPTHTLLDIVDFMYNLAMLEGGQGGHPGKFPTEAGLQFFTTEVEGLRPDIAHLFRHLTSSGDSSVYSAMHAASTSS